MENKKLYKVSPNLMLHSMQREEYEQILPV